MAGFGTGWHSYSFKSNLRSRFNRKDGKITRPVAKNVPSNPSFFQGVATKDVNINDDSGLTVRIFLPMCAAQQGKINDFGWMMKRMGAASEKVPEEFAEEFWGSGANGNASGEEGGGGDAERGGAEKYAGYMPKTGGPSHKLPVMVQFHGGGFVMGSKDSMCNDTFCRRLARVCNSLVVAVGYRLAPEHRCPIAYEDGYEVLKWLSKQAILAENEQQQQEEEQQQQQDLQQQPAAGLGFEMEGGLSSNSLGEQHRDVARSLVQDLPDPWLATHADVSRTVLVGVSSGGNIADQVARRAVHPQGVNELNPLVVVGQVLLYPLFGGSKPTPSEIKSKDAYFYDRPTCELVFKLFLQEDDFSMDHPAVNPMLRDQLPPGMPATLFIVADLDILTDRAIAYSVFLRSHGVDAQVNSYKDVVHDFASHESMVNTPQAEACVDDLAMWLMRHISPKGSELAY